MSTAIILMAQISTLVAFGGSRQIDLHMAYFAALALLILYNDWGVILAAAATVAVHHLVLGFALPTAVFEGSTSLERVSLHAVILIVEAAVLIWVVLNLDRMFAISRDALTRAEQAAEASVQASAAAQQAHLAEKLARDQAGTVVLETQTEERALVVDSIGSAIKKLTEGDLTHRIDSQMPGEYGRLCTDFNAAVTALQSTIALISSITSEIGSESTKISTSADDLSHRTAGQAANLEETAAALNEITNRVLQTSEGAAKGRILVGSAEKDAGHSGEVVRRAVDAMGGIERSSGQIGQIVNVIDEIAFQTNLLALNAGVEAARAGDAGRGFAVVASEVRALAQRSAEAAKEIKSLIAASSTEVRRGVALVGETGDALDRIVKQVADINNVMVEIASASEEQALGLHQVNIAITQMDKVTQQNASMVEQSTAASRALARQAGELTALVQRFDVGSKERQPQAVLKLRRRA